MGKDDTTEVVVEGALLEAGKDVASYALLRYGSKASLTVCMVAVAVLEETGVGVGAPPAAGSANHG